MAIVLLKVIGTWSAVAIFIGFGLGAMIRRSERLRKDAFLSCVFSYMETMQMSRS
jgi:hypothetical protein